MSGEAHAVIHFMDGTKIVFKYPRLQAKQAMDSSTIASTVKKALDQDKIVVEADGSLIVIPVRNIKYRQIVPPPDALPAVVLKNAQIVE